MATLHTKLKLNTGAEIPRIYGTEPAVGTAIKKSGIPRSEIFITTKLWNNSHHPDDVEPALDASLKDLGTDYIDLYLMHWPSPFARGDTLMPKRNGKIQTGDIDYVDTWKAMEKTLKTGKTKAIGISNFSHAELSRLLKSTTIVLAAHQIELHPYLQQPSFAAFHATKNIHVQQYSPFGNSNPTYNSSSDSRNTQSLLLIDDPTLVNIGKRYGKSGAQVALAWGIAHGRSVLPRSKTPERTRSNLAGDFELEKGDLERSDKIDKETRYNDPSATFGWDFYADLDGKK